MTNVIHATFRPRALVLACLVLTLAACASAPRQGMYWGNYEASLYQLADAPTDRVQERHLSNLRQVVSVSDARGWAPPPGAMLELAVLEQGLGNHEAYALLVNREYHLYPESRAYILRWFSDVMVTVSGVDTDNAEATDAQVQSDTDPAPANEGSH